MGSTSLPVGAALVDAQLADAVARALVDGDRDLDAAAIGREHDARRADGDLEEAAVVVERADHRDVAFEGVLAERAARAEGEEPRVAGEHQRAQLFGRDVLVADERDAPDAHLAGAR